MTQIIIHPDSQGGVLVTSLAPGLDPVTEASLLFSNTSYHVVDDSVLPADKTQQQAWEFVDDPTNPIRVNPAKFVVTNLQGQLDAIFETLPVSTQAQLSPLKAAIKLELDQGHNDVAKAIVQGATIPPELEPLRSQMLSKF